MYIKNSAPGFNRARTLKWVMVMTASLCMVTPAHAISRAYRAQLERSGCSQMTDAAGTCDITRTKAQNRANNLNAQPHSLRIDHMIGKSIDEVASQLIAGGWKATGGRWYHDNRVLTLTVAANLVTAVSLEHAGQASMTLSEE